IRGTGLGLAIVKQIAQLHGGHVEAEANWREVRRFAWFCRLSHKRNSKDFDQLNRLAAILSHDQTTRNSWANDRVGIERERIGADDDQRRGRDVPVSDLLEVVRRIRKSRSLGAI